MIDERLGPDEQEVMTPGEAVAGMILHGRGFAKRPLSLPPQFFANKPLDLLLREGLEAEMCNRCKLGRTLDEAHAYGCTLLCEALALAVWTHEGIALRFHHLAPTRLSLTGDSIPESEEHALGMTHGYAKDHRPDLKQAVWALLVSQDGGIPCVRKSWDGTTSDTRIFQERAEALLSAFTPTPSPRSRIAAATRSCEAQVAPLATLGFLTRMPATLTVVAQGISQALQWHTWHPGAPPTRSQPLALGHSGMVQRWLVVSAPAALERAAATLKKATPRAHETITKPLFPLQAQRFGTPQAAHEALAALAQCGQSHCVASSHLTAHQRYAGQGRPTPRTPLKASAWQIQAHVHAEDHAIEQDQQAKACFGLGTNSAACALSDPEVLAAYQGPSHVEGGCRFLQAPLFFVASLFVKKPSRIEGLLMVMPLALLVYSVAPRRLRAQWATHQETVPNHIKQPTPSPTLRWGFQLLAGIHRIRITVQGQAHALIEGLHDVQVKILRLFGHAVCRLYQISPG
jgi:transposase